MSKGYLTVVPKKVSEASEIREGDLLDRIRDVRHAGQYNLSYTSSDDEARSCLEAARNFVERMRTLFEETGDPRRTR